MKSSEVLLAALERPGLAIRIIGRKLYDRKCKRCGREVKAQ